MMCGSVGDYLPAHHFTEGRQDNQIEGDYAANWVAWQPKDQHVPAVQQTLWVLQ